MALYSKLYNLIYLHPPKTGGTWISHILRKTMKIEELGHQHIHFPELYSIKNMEWFKDKFMFTTIRHPITWYQSRWAFRVKTGWKAQHPLDFNCASNDFNTFVDNVLKYKPDGWLTYLMQGYTNQAPSDNLEILRIEDNLADGVAKIYDKLKIKYDKRLLVNCNKANASDSSNMAKYAPELYDRVLRVERGAKYLQ